jgi:hypothetical protein
MITGMMTMKANNTPTPGKSKIRAIITVAKNKMAVLLEFKITAVLKNILLRPSSIYPLPPINSDNEHHRQCSV